MAVVGDGAVVANMLVATVKMGTSLTGSSFHSKHIGTFLVEGRMEMLLYWKMVWYCS